jgi:hypothetical protein
VDANAVKHVHAILEPVIARIFGFTIDPGEGEIPPDIAGALKIPSETSPPQEIMGRGRLIGGLGLLGDMDVSNNGEIQFKSFLNLTLQVECITIDIYKAEELEERGGDQLESVCRIDIIGVNLDISTLDYVMKSACIGIMYMYMYIYIFIYMYMHIFVYPNSV